MKTQNIIMKIFYLILFLGAISSIILLVIKLQGIDLYTTLGEQNNDVELCKIFLDENSPEDANKWCSKLSDENLLKVCTPIINSSTLNKQTGKIKNLPKICLKPMANNYSICANAFCKDFKDTGVKKRCLVHFTDVCK